MSTPGTVLAAAGAVAALTVFALVPGMRTSTEDTDSGLPHAVAVLAARSPGREIVLSIQHQAWIDTTGFGPGQRARVRACVDGPYWTFMMTKQFICTPQQAARGARYTFDSPRAPLSTPVLLHFGHSDVVARPRPDAEGAEVTAHDRMFGADRGVPGTGLPEGRRTGRGSGAPAARRALRAGWAAGIAVAAVVLFLCYLRLSDRVPAGSDGGSIALQAWEMLHGNVLLRHWTVLDVSFYPAELVQYALIEAVRGLGPEVVHIAGAMTYTLILLLAAWLAKGRATGREGLIRALVAVVVMLAPAPGMSPTLLVGPDHVGSAVPVLLAWLTVDLLPGRQAGRPRWYVPPAVAILLAWGQFADGLILITGVAPMVIVCGVRAAWKLWHRRPGSSAPGRGRARSGGAREGRRRAAGPGRRSRWPSRRSCPSGWPGWPRPSSGIAGDSRGRPVPTAFAGLAALPHHLQLTAEGLLGLFGADFSGSRSRPDLAFAALHLIVVAAAALAFLLALRRLGRDDELAVPGLAIAIVLNVAAYVPTQFVQDLLSTRDISAVLPFAAVLTGRLLGGPLLRGRLTAAFAIFAAACAAALGYNAAQPAEPAQGQSLVAWLATRQLSGGLAVDYWVANITTLDSGNRITVRQVGLGAGVLTEPVPRELNSGWYRPAGHYADFYVAHDINPNSSAEQAAAVRTFGPPAQTLHAAGYTVLVWHKNLLAGLR